MRARLLPQQFCKTLHKLSLVSRQDEILFPNTWLDWMRREDSFVDEELDWTLPESLGTLADEHNSRLMIVRIDLRLLRGMRVAGVKNMCEVV